MPPSVKIPISVLSVDKLLFDYVFHGGPDEYMGT